MPGAAHACKVCCAAARRPRPSLTRPPPNSKQIEWGARDPTAGEIGSNFSEKVLGNWDTAHIIR